MKLVYIVDSLGPYHHARFTQLARRLDRDTKFVVLELYRQDDTYDWLPVESTLEYERITVSDRPPAGLRERRLEFISLAERLNVISPDYVVLPGWRLGATMAVLNWCLNRSISMVLLSDSTKGDKKRNIVAEYLKSRVIQACSSAFVAGNPQQAYLVDLGYDPALISTGYDVIDNAHFAGFRSADDSPRTFLTVSRFVQKKNLFCLIDAYAEYLTLCTTQPWRLQLAGDGPLRSAIEQHISAKNLSENVSLLGFVQYGELPGVYHCADAFVLASTSEQWGLVVNEAMASGLPVLVSRNCGCAMDLVEEGRNGYTFEASDPVELARLMNELSARSDLLAMGNESRKIIADWDLDRFAKGLLEALGRADRSRHVPRVTRVVTWLLMLSSLIVEVAE